MFLRKEKVSVVKCAGILAILILALLSGSRQAHATVVADIVSDWVSNSWPANPFPDSSGGSWTFFVMNDDRSIIAPLGADVWLHPVRGTPTLAYDTTPINVTPNIVSLSLFDTEFLAALPWNCWGLPGAAEYRVYTVWTSGVSGNVNVSGTFKYMGDAGSSVLITQPGTGMLLGVTQLSPGAAEVPYSVNTSVNTGDFIVFAIGTGLNRYSGWDDETLFNVRIIPEPATVGLLGLGSMVMVFKCRF